MPTTALATDQYELTMVRTLRASGLAQRRAVFEVFTRHLPAGRGYGVVAGTGRLLEAMTHFRPDGDQVEWLVRRGVLDEETGAWFAGYRFSGHVDGYREGELFFPHSPVLTFTGPLAEALVLETLTLSILNFDSAVASAAARMRSASTGRLVEMGSRRTHEDAAIAAARAAYLVGFDATSNLAAGHRYGIPTVGTAAHALTLAHLAVPAAEREQGPAREATAEAEAFRSQMATLGTGSTLVVDTFDTARGIEAAVKAAHLLGAEGPGAVRIDSGDLVHEVGAARERLDAVNAFATGVTVTGDLDEYRLAELEGTAAGTFGVGTALVTGSGHPTVGFVFKLVAIAESDEADAPMIPVAKRAPGKGSTPGVHLAWRRLDRDGHGVGDRVVAQRDCPEPLPSGALAEDTPTQRALQVRLVEDGKPRVTATLDDARAHHRAVMAELRPSERALHLDRPAYAEPQP